MSTQPGRAPLIVGESEDSSRARPAPVGAWLVLAVVGWVFLVVGGMDVGLVWYPTAFGSVGWEFGSITASLNGLPLPVMGIALMLASAVARADQLSARLAMVFASVLAILVVVGGLLYALGVPLALRSVTDPLGLMGLKKAIFRSLVQLVAYPAVLGWAVVRARRLLRTGDSR
jgi:hypothetical protein